MSITPKEFVEKWSKSTLREQQAAQEHFLDVCQLVGHPTPAEKDPQGRYFTFERHVAKSSGGQGRADVWLKGNFAWEYKGKHKDLSAAYSQLLQYSDDLSNPPLLVVCDFDEFHIHPRWTNIDPKPFVFKNADLLNDATLDMLRWLFYDPEQFLKRRQEEQAERERITQELAYKFAHLADLMRDYKAENGKPLWDSMRIARFLTKVVFALFAEDIGLLLPIRDLSPMSYLIEYAHEAEGAFLHYLGELFRAMNGEQSFFMMRRVPFFNGSIFADSAPGANDATEALDITLLGGDAIKILEEASAANWRKVDPTIFGTLFEGALDKGKRAQLGAHYTGEADIRRVVEPVVIVPLRRRWQAITDSAKPLLEIFKNPQSSPRQKVDAENELRRLYNDMRDTLKNTRVLDPACGSGNFLYVTLRLMKDVEQEVRGLFAPLNIPFEDIVTPRQLYGIEKDPFAAKLAHIVVWIGYLQWRYEHEGRLIPWRRTSRPEANMLPNPIIQDKNTPDEPDHILCDDAIMRYDAEGKPYEPEWAEVDYIVGNPPFLGDKIMRSGRPELGLSGLGDQYVDDLRDIYGESIPGQSDLVCYWFEKARAHIETGKAKRAGLLATNSIRQGANRTVLERIKTTGNIFMAWSDLPWALDGAAVRISIVGFDNGDENDYTLSGVPVMYINADLQNTIDATKAQVLTENLGLSYVGIQKTGEFDISDEQAKAMLSAINPNALPNSDVLKPFYNAKDIIDRGAQRWIIDFGVDTTLETAMKYQLPFEHLRNFVLPIRSQNRREGTRTRWWIHGEARPGMRKALQTLNRYIVTPRVAKHRLFVWLNSDELPDSRVLAIARDDDYFFGVLHALPHELWAVRLASWHGVGNDPTYNAESCFETFPFPYPPAKEPTDDAKVNAIAAAAKALHEERHAWLNPVVDPNDRFANDVLRKRTLTNLYNALEKYRSGSNGKRNGTDAADAFAPRLAQLHDALDRAVLAAYGWDDLADKLRTPDGDEELLRRLLALNLARAGQ